MTQLKFKVKKGDTVQVITGKDKGKRGTVSKILREESKLIVDGINLVTRHVKASAQNPNGSYSKNLPVHISNVAIVDPSTNTPSKVGFRTSENGQKVRYFKKSNQEI